MEANVSETETATAKLAKAYAEALAQIDNKAHEAREQARITLREQLNVLRDAAHKELKAIRTLEQKTKGGRKNAG